MKMGQKWTYTKKEGGGWLTKHIGYKKKVKNIQNPIRKN